MYRSLSALVLSLLSVFWHPHPVRALVYVASSGVANTTSTITIPSVVHTGDWMLAIFTRANGDTTTGPSGWTKICTLYNYSGTGPVTVAGQVADIYQRTATVADLGGSVTVIETGSTNAGSGFLAFRNQFVNSFGMDAFDCQGNTTTANGQGTGTSLTSQVLSTAFSGDVLLTVFLPTSTFTPPGDETVIVNQTSSPQMWVGYKTAVACTTASSGNLAPNGCIDKESGTQSVSGTWAALSIAIAPSDAGATKNEDTYRGYYLKQCSKGPSTHFYTQLVGQRWTLCDPLGNVYWFNAIEFTNYGSSSGYVSPNSSKTYCQGSNQCLNKYNGGPLAWNLNWADAQIMRLKTWGFNAISYNPSSELLSTVANSWPPADGSPPFKLPFIYQDLGTRYAESNVNNWCQAANGIKVVSVGYKFGDYYDPLFSTCLAGSVNSGLGSRLGYGSNAPPHSDYFLAFNPDESDDTLWEKYDFKWTGIDTTVTGQSGLTNPAANTVWVTLTAAPTQAGYTSQEVYTKKALANWELNNYAGVSCAAVTQGTYSVDPAAGNFAGSIIMTAATNCLNTAWASFYTTLSTSDSTHCSSNLDTCLSGGTYAVYGTGTGLLDENGTCPSRGGNPCWVSSDSTKLTGQTAAMNADFAGFEKAYVHNYAAVLGTVLHAAAPGVLVFIEAGSSGGPSRTSVLQQLASEIDGGNLNFVSMVSLPPYLCTTSNSTVPCTQPPFQTSHAYALNDLIYPSNNNTNVNVFKVTGAGAAGTEPNWDSSCTSTCTSGATTFTNQGPSINIQARIDWLAEQYGNHPYIVGNQSINSNQQTMAFSTPVLNTAQLAVAWGTGVTLIEQASSQFTHTFSIIGYDDIYYYDNTAGIPGFVTPADNAYDGVCDVTTASVTDPLTGYTCGNEINNFGDWTDSMATSQNGIYLAIWGAPGGPPPPAFGNQGGVAAW